MLAIYARISQDKGDNISSIENQIHFGKEYAKKLNLSYKIYQDVGVSGTLPIEQRSALLLMMEDILSKEITDVYAYEQSRLERNTTTWGSLCLFFKENNIKLHFNSGEFNFDSPDSFLNSGILSVFNSFFVKLTQQKIVNALQKNIENGKVHASPPFGYTKDSNKFLIVDKEEAKIVERIYAMSLEGKGTDKIAEILNLEGVPTAYCKLEKGGVYKIRDRYNSNIVTEKKKSDAKWRGRTIQGIIKNTIYKGLRLWRGNYYPAPQIFDEVYWQKVNDNLQNNRNNTGKKVEHKYLLKGIIKCNCERNMYGRSRMNKRDHTYICSSRRYKGENCGNRAINIDKIENLIWEHFFIRKELLNMLNQAPNERDKLLESLIKDKEIIENKINESQREKTNLIRNVAKGNLKDEDVKDEVERIENDINRLNLEKSQYDSRIADVQNFENLIVDTRTDFENFSKDVDFDTKRSLIHKYVEKIIVAYDDGKEHKNGYKFPPYTYHIQIEFKNGIVKENYIYNVKSGVIMSFRDRTFKFFTEEGIVETMDLEAIDNIIFSLNNGKTYVKPFLVKDNHPIILDNTIIPFGDVGTWSEEMVVDFYTLNKYWLSKESGINIWIEDKTHDSYQWFVQNYKNYHDKPLIEWVTFLFEALKYNGLLVSKGKTKYKFKK